MALRERFTERSVVRRALQDYGLRSPNVVDGPYSPLPYVPTDPDQLLWACIGGQPGTAPTIAVLARHYKCDAASMSLVCAAIMQHTDGRETIPYKEGWSLLRKVAAYLGEVAHHENPKTSRRFTIPKHKDATPRIHEIRPAPTREQQEEWDKMTRYLNRGYRGDDKRTEVIVPIKRLEHEWKPRLWKKRKCARCYRCRRMGLCRKHYTTHLRDKRRPTDHDIPGL